MTLEESRQLYFAGCGGVLRPADLVREAWADEPFRRSVTFDMAKCVSRNNSFSDVFWLDTLRGVLSPEQARDLYVAIRDQSRMVEFGWRAEFIAAFPAAEPLLPPVAVDDKLRFSLLHLLAQAIDAQDFDGVRRVIGQIDDFGIPYTDLGRIRPESIAEGGVYFEYTYPDDATAVTLLELARQKSTPVVVRVLEEYAGRGSAG
jgi:hypothetical protein